jgi:UDP-N-acetylmuramoylalanine--D-glutamate ligase
MTSLESFSKDFGNKRILIMGIGILGGGVKLVKFLSKVGCKITISDQKTKEQLISTISKIDNLDIQYSLGSHRLEDLDGADFIIRNPAVPKDHPILLTAIEKNIPIYLEAALFAKYSQKPIIGVTGTRGKTTTTLLIEHILNNTDHKQVKLAGNIPGTCALSLLETENTSNHWGTILELSSWQLQGFDDLKISPHIAVLTNIYEDHLNRYLSMSDYIRDKQVITKHQSSKDFFVFNGQNQSTANIAKTSLAQTFDFSKQTISENKDFKLIGPHNLENLKASLQVAKILGVSDKIISNSLKSFHPVPFRLEPIKIINQVTYINDTTSTTPIALISALNSIHHPTILIMGGNSKNLSLGDLVTTINQNQYLSKIILIPGTGTDEIKSKISSYQEKDTLEEAIKSAHLLAKPGDIVLFSPGFTSFSQFNNEFERGEFFNQIVNQL